MAFLLHINPLRKLSQLEDKCLNIVRAVVKPHPKFMDVDFTINLRWLRDNCQCEECFNAQTHQKNNGSIILDSEVKKYETVDNVLRITWESGHRSVYSYGWLSERLIKYYKENTDIQEVLWKNKDEICDKVANISRVELENNSESEREIITSILKYGVAMVRDVPATLEATEKVVTKIGPVMETMYGKMWKSSDNYNGPNLETNDTAYTNLELDPHTDNTYFYNPAGLQIFHAFTASKEGGLTMLVDGFQAANILKQENQAHYDCLKDVPVQWSFISEQNHYQHFGPILTEHPFTGQLTHIRYNMYDRGTKLPITKRMDLFYESLKHMNDIMESLRNGWRMKLEPGTVLFLNNWRVLHGRTEYTGPRVLGGCYMDMSAFLSRARLLKLITRR